MAGELFTQPGHILGFPVEPVHQFQGRRRIPVQDRLGHLEQMLPPGQAGGLVDHFHRHLAAAAKALVQQGQRVPHGAVRQPGNEQARFPVQRSFFLLSHIFQSVGNVLGGNPMKVKPLAPGENGCRQFVDLRRGQNKQHMGRRFFQGFQQGVEGPLRQHMYLIDNIHPVPGGSGGKGRLFPELPDIVHAVVAGGVNLHHIHYRAAFHAPADLTFPTRVPVYRVQAVHRFCQNLCTGGLSGPSGTGEQVGVGHPAGHEFVLEGYCHLGLAHHVCKDLRPPFPV